jgi:hypothetical protein
MNEHAVRRWGLLAAAAWLAACPAAAHDRGWIRVLPIAGVPGEDFYVGYQFDCHPAAGASRDYMGGNRTYDGHQGTDFGVAGFDVMELGVPVLAVADGVVTSVIDGQDDGQTANRRGRLGNNIRIDHGQGRESYYGHLKSGSLAVRPGQKVHTGQQIAEVGSSGDSNGPHLHFECLEDRRPIDPFAPPDRPVESRWLRQPQYDYPMKTVDAGVAPRAVEHFLEMPRMPFVREDARRLDFWVLTMNQEAGEGRRWELLRPDGSRDAAWNETVDKRSEMHQSWWWVQSPELSRGKWTVRVYQGRRLVVRLPLVVLGANEPPPRNRAPSRPRAMLEPRSPAADEPVMCRVALAGPAADPDLDRVRYRYVWSLDDRVVRDATTAVRGDYLPSASATPGAALRCQVFATDGQLAGPPATLTAEYR